MKYLFNPPKVIKNIFDDVYWESGVEKILLTFDDGPLIACTEEVLKFLDEEKVKAVFFCVGENVEKYPSLCQSVLNEGHTIGNHTYRHRVLTACTSDEMLEEMNSFNQIMKERFNYDTIYFRPPHGKFNYKVRRAVREVSMKTVLWSLLTFDYQNDLNLVKFAVKKFLMPNSIIVMHDSRKSKFILIDSLKYIVEQINEKGYQLGEPAECLK